MKTATVWIQSLQLQPHPEGGWFKEVYRSEEQIPQHGLPHRFTDKRSIATAIYFMLEANEISVFHRIKSDETWHFYNGEPLELHVIDPKGNYQKLMLGLYPEQGIMPQVTIPHGCWFAARSLGAYTLVGCTVAPGFDFHDFEMAERNYLTNEFPQHTELILQFTKTP
ncbi:MAG: cupin domain-containing protein [Bacteroidales bacterium]|nr:cupin domain-containing protein [Bacteroidales bacterium]